MNVPSWLSKVSPYAVLSEATFVGGAVLAVALALALDGFSGAWAFAAGGLVLGALATAAGGAISTDIATNTTTVAIWSIAETTRDLALCEEPPIATPLASRPYRGACAPTPPQRLPSGPAGSPSLASRAVARSVGPAVDEQDVTGSPGSAWGERADVSRIA